MLDFFAVGKFGNAAEIVAMFPNLGDAKEWVRSLTHEEWLRRGWEIRSVHMDAPHHIGEQDWA